MGDFTYENQGANTYLVYALADNELLDSVSLGMITNNKISGLASTMFMQMNATKYIKYNISSRIPMSQFLAGLVNRKRLLGIFNGIVDAMLSAEDYMIDSNAIILDEDFIYVDVSSFETILICLPVLDNGQGNVELGMFFKNIMFKTQFDQTEDCNYVTKILNYLNGAYMFSLEDFGDLLRGFEKEAAVTDKAHHVSSGDESSEERCLEQSHPVSFEAMHLESVQSSDKQPEPKVSLQPAVQKPMDMHSPVSITAAKSMLPDSASDSNEKSMSLLYLLRHYDKENANIYKAQKAEKKERGASKKQSKKEKASAKAKTGKTKRLSGFAIPNAPVSAAQSEPMQTPLPAQQQKQPDSLPVPQPEKSITAQVSISAAEGNPGVGFGDTVYENRTDVTIETTMLEQSVSPEQKIRPFLIRKKNNERIPVYPPLFRLGRNREYNDYVVDGNGHIGNSHCHIVTKDGEYFIVDDNSMNHTYVDGAMIPSGSEVKLAHGQSLALADEEFEFRLF